MTSRPCAPSSTGAPPNSGVPCAARSSAAACSAWRRPAPCRAWTSSAPSCSPRTSSCRRSSTPAARTRCAGSSSRGASPCAPAASPRGWIPTSAATCAASNSARATTPTPTWSCSRSECGPRDQLARAAELKVDPRGGVIIDAGCTTSDPRILAIGEVANFDGRVPRPRGPRRTPWPKSRRPAARRRRDLPRLRRRRPSSSSPGVDVASFGDAFARTARCARDRLRRPRGGRLQEARPLGRRADPAGRHPRRRRQRVRDAASDARRPARRRPGRLPHAGGRRRCAGERRAARRRARVLLQQRDRRDDPRRRDRRRLHGRRRSEGLHPRRDRVRLVPAAGQEAPRHRARPQRREPQHRTVRALRALARPAVRRRPRLGAAHVQRDHRALRHRARLRHLQAGHRQHPGLPRPRPRPRRRDAHPAGHQRPRDGEHAEGRHLLGRPAHRRRRDHAGGARW